MASFLSAHGGWGVNYYVGPTVTVAPAPGIYLQPMIWTGPGYYWGVWFGNQGDFNYYYTNHRHGGHGHGGHGHGGGHGGGHHH